jgi:hypothetical protein
MFVVFVWTASRRLPANCLVTIFSTSTVPMSGTEEIRRVPSVAVLWLRWPSFCHRTTNGSEWAPWKNNQSNVSAPLLNKTYKHVQKFIMITQKSCLIKFCTCNLLRLWVKKFPCVV